MTFPSPFAPANPPIADWKGRRVWIIGASTGIGEATASALHARGAQVHASARNAGALVAFADAHPGAACWPMDSTDRALVEATAREILARGPLDLVVYCAGHYRALDAAAFDVDEMLRHNEVNYVGAVHVLGAVVPALVAAGRGHVSLVGSVAGFRGLPRSLGYGPTKAALIQLAEIMHMELRPRGVGVSIVNPGFVRTPLTAQNDFHMPALITPQEAASEMLKGWERGRFEMHFPRRFTWPMKLLAALPFALYEPIVRKGTGS